MIGQTKDKGDYKMRQGKKYILLENTSPPQIVYIYLCCAATLIATVSTASAYKIISLYSELTASVSVISYLASYIVSDVANELFGKAEASMLKWIGIASTISTVCITQVYINLPPAPDWKYQHEYSIIFGAIPRLILAGVTAFYLAQSMNIRLFAWLARTLPTWPFIRRKLCCDLITHVPDTLLFVVIGFAGTTISLPNLLSGQFTAKIFITLLYLPVSHYCLFFIRSYITRNSQACKVA